MTLPAKKHLDTTPPPSRERLRVSRGLGRALLAGLGVMTAGRAIVSAIGFATKVLLARLLGPAGLGVYGVVTYGVGVVAQLANLGTQNAHIHNLGKRHTTLGEAYGLSLAYACGAGVLAVGLFLLNYHFWLYDAFFAKYLQPKYSVVLWVFATIPIHLLLLHLNAVLLGLHRFTVYNVFLSLEAGSLLILLLLFSSLFQSSLVAAVWAWSASALGTTLGVSIYLQRELSPAPLRASLSHLRNALAYGSKALVAGIAQTLTVQLGLFIVAFFIGPEGAGVYFLASTLALMLQQGSVVLGQLLFPYDATLKRAHAVLLTNTSFRVVMTAFIATLPMTVPLALYGTPWVFGEQYRQTATLFLMLFPGAIAASLSRIIYSFFLAQNKHDYVIMPYVLTLVGLVVLDATLIPRIGVAGAAIGLSAAYILGLFSIVQRYSTYTRTGVKQLRPLWVVDFHRLRRAIART